VLPVSQNPLEVWPLLLGKALLKLQQGVEASSSTFLHSLCGWIAQATDAKSAEAQDAGFTMHEELQRGGACLGALMCSELDDGAVIAQALATKSLKKTVPVTVPPQPVEGEEVDADALLTDERILFRADGRPFFASFSMQMLLSEDAAPEKKDSKDGSKKGKKSKKEVEDDAKAAAAAVQRQGSLKESEAKKRPTKKSKSAKILDDPSIPKYTVVDLYTGGAEVVTAQSLSSIFDDVLLVYAPASFGHKQHIEDVWTDIKQPFCSTSPLFLYIPPVAENAEEAGTSPKPAFCKVLLSCEAHAAKPPLRPEVIEGEDISITEPEPEITPTGATVAVQRIDWASNSRVLVAGKASPNRATVLELLLPLSAQGCVSRVVIQADFGYYLSVLSAAPLLLESSKEGGGEVWEGPMKMNYSHHSAKYPSVRADTWSVLFKYVINVSSPGHEGGKTSTKGKTPAKGAAKGGAGKGGAGGGDKVDVLPSNVPVPFEHDVATWLSVCVNFNDARVAACCALEIVNNDTYQSAVLGLLESGPLKLAPNDHGYTLVASVRAKEALPAGSWSTSVVSSRPLASFAPESVTSVLEFEEVYKPKLHRGMLRHVVSTAKPEQVALEVRTNDPEAALLCSVFSVQDILDTPEDEPLPGPIFTLTGRSAVYMPVLRVSKDDRYLLDVRLDPLRSGTLLTADGKQPGIGSGDMAPKKLTWKLSCVSSGAVVVQNDKTQEEEFSVIKTAWHKASGRDKKAKASRDAFLEEGADVGRADVLSKAIVTPVAQVSGAPVDLLPAREARGLANDRGEKLVSAMGQQRSLYMQRQEEHEEQRVEQRKAAVARYGEELASRLQQRGDVRGKLGEQNGLLSALRSIIASAPNKEKAAAAAAAVGGKKDAKKGNAAELSATAALSLYLVAVEQAIAALEGVPVWKSEELVSEARVVVRKLVIAALQDAMVVAVTPAPAEDPKAKGGKGKKEELEDPRHPVVGVLDILTTTQELSPASVDRTVGLWVERAGAFVVDLTSKELGACLHGTDAEGVAVEVDKTRVEHLLRRLEAATKEQSSEITALMADANLALERISVAEPAKAKGKK
jgi:hypothetical protein